MMPTRSATHRCTLALATVLTLAGTVLSGCISVGVGNDSGVRPLFVLHDPGAAAPDATKPLPAPLVPTLLIQALPADAVAETVSIAYSRRPHELAFYKLASWNERPVRRIPRLLEQRLSARGVAGAVGLLGEPLQSNWLLTIGVDRLVHDVATPPGTARVQITAALYDRGSGRRLGSRSFEAAEAAASADSAAAVAAMSQAVGRSFDALQPWVESLLQGVEKP